MQVKYVGRQARHRDRLYGTRVVFAGPGDIQEVEDESVARKMIARHPDQYAEVGASNDAGAKVNGSEGSDPGGDSADEKGPEILIDGEYKPVKDATKKELLKFAKDTFEVDLNKRDTVGTLAGEVVALIEKAKAEVEQQGQD